MKRSRRSSKVALSRSVRKHHVPAWWLEVYFGPLQRFLEVLSSEGPLELTPSGMPVLVLANGSTYYPLAEMWRMAEVFRIARVRDPLCPDSDPLFRGATELLTGSPISAPSIAELRCCLETVRAYAATQSRSEMLDLVQTARIAVELTNHNFSPRLPALTPR